MDSTAMTLLVQCGCAGYGPGPGHRNAKAWISLLAYLPNKNLQFRKISWRFISSLRVQRGSCGGAHVEEVWDISEVGKLWPDWGWEDFGSEVRWGELADILRNVRTVSN